VLATAFLVVAALPLGVWLLPAPQAITSVRSTVVMWVTAGDPTPSAVAKRSVASGAAEAGAWIASTIWVVITLALAIRMAVGLGRRRRFAMTAAPWAEAILKSTGLPGVERVKVMQCAGSVVPETLGFVRPVLVLPPAARMWSEERLRVVLTHEMVHVLRHDWLVGIVAEAAAILHWFNPLAWRALALLRQERELACDDEVLRQGGVDEVDYAGHLVDIAAAVEAGAVAMAQVSSLETRVRSILNSGIRRGGVSMKGKLFAAAVAAVVVVLLSGLQAPAQGNAALSGTVRDASQAYVPGAAVLLTNTLEKGRREIARTDDVGAFRFGTLPPGKYQIEVSKPGFQLYRHDVLDLVAGSAQQLQVMLNLGRVAETMSVTGTRTLPTAVAAEEAEKAQEPKRVRIGGNVQATKIVKQVRPPYPAHLKDQGIEGSVLLEAVIGRDGKLLNLHPVNTLAHPDLMAAATEAVSQWEYAPTFLNGNPVEVITTIQINFTLQN